MLNGGQDAVSLNGKPSNQLIKTNTIGLVPAPAGESFSVLDANATDSNGALFQLPADVSISWTVWARALGTPGGSAIQTTCASSFLDVLAGQIYCSSQSAMYMRTTGKSLFAIYGYHAYSTPGTTSFTLAVYDVHGSSCIVYSPTVVVFAPTQFLDLWAINADVVRAAILYQTYSGEFSHDGLAYQQSLAAYWLAVYQADIAAYDRVAQTGSL